MLRIVTVNLRTRATHEYLYLLDNPKDAGTAFRGRRPKRPDRPVRFGTFGLPADASME